MNSLRYFEVRLVRGGRVHLADAEATVGGMTLCGQRWWYREPVFDPYASPYTEPPEHEHCQECESALAEQED